MPRDNGCEFPLPRQRVQVPNMAVQTFSLLPPPVPLSRPRCSLLLIPIHEHSGPDAVAAALSAVSAAPCSVGVVGHVPTVCSVAARPLITSGRFERYRVVGMAVSPATTGTMALNSFNFPFHFSYDGGFLRSHIMAIPTNPSYYRHVSPVI